MDQDIKEVQLTDLVVTQIKLLKEQQEHLQTKKDLINTRLENLVNKQVADHKTDTHPVLKEIKVTDTSGVLIFGKEDKEDS